MRTIRQGIAVCDARLNNKSIALCRGGTGDGFTSVVVGVCIVTGVTRQTAGLIGRRCVLIVLASPAVSVNGSRWVDGDIITSRAGGDRHAGCGVIIRIVPRGARAAILAQSIRRCCGSACHTLTHAAGAPSSTGGAREGEFVRIARITGTTIEVLLTRRTRRARGAAFSRRVMVGTLLTCSTAGGIITRNTRGAVCPGKDAIATACPGPSAFVTLSAGHGYLRANGPVELGIVITP